VDKLGNGLKPLFYTAAAGKRLLHPCLEKASSHSSNGSVQHPEEGSAALTFPETASELQIPGSSAV